MTKAQTKRAEAIAELRPLIPEGSTVYSIIRHVSRSGMQREISFLIFAADTYTRRAECEPKIAPYYLSRLFSAILDWRMSSNDRAAIKVNGCGMDMCSHTLDCIRAALGYKEQFRSEQL